jgi:menaquinone-dependent protoporphyrinogen oxidase
MRDPVALVLYATKHGHTATIAERIADQLTELGVDAALRHLDADADPSPGDYDAVVIAASVHGGAHARDVRDYASRHRTLLSNRPSALVSVSLTAADDSDESRAATRQVIDELLDDTGWIPTTTLAVAGALQYREYDIVSRLVMRLIAARYGGSTDSTFDHEYTDWEALDRLIASFATTVTSHATPA